MHHHFTSNICIKSVQDKKRTTDITLSI
uniref:Uncharacterized protein n=1 Tax=Arundo donax TaxID=35708 RepID=A0A0A9BC09_ARUDO